MDCIEEKNDCQKCMSQTFRKPPTDVLQAVMCSLKESQWLEGMQLSFLVENVGADKDGVYSKKACHDAQYQIFP